MRTLNKTIASITLVLMSLAAEAQYPGGLSTNLDLWINASNLPVSGPVTSWPSLTANGYVLKDANMAAPSISTRKHNGHPVVYFDGIDDRLDLGASTMYSSTDGMMMFYVVKPDKPVGYNSGAFVVDYGFVSDYGYGSKFGTEMYGAYANHAGTYSIDNTTHKKDIISLATTQYIFSNNIRFSVDGKQIFDKPLPTTVFDATTIHSGGPFTVGSQSKAFDQSRLFHGDLAELIIYSNNMSALEISKIESYLAVKYGITLEHDYISSGGTKTWDRTKNAGYNNNVFGLGRDDASSLDQNVSHSEFPDALLTASLSGSTIPNDNTFIMIGNNSGTTQFTRSLGSVANVLMDRVWKVQKTGTMQGLGLSFSKADLSGGEAIKMVISKDETFDASDASVALTKYTGADGLTYYKTSYELEDGDYFTFSTPKPISIKLTSDKYGLCDGMPATLSFVIPELTAPYPPATWTANGTPFAGTGSTISRGNILVPTWVKVSVTVSDDYSPSTLADSVMLYPYCSGRKFDKSDCIGTDVTLETTRTGTLVWKDGSTFTESASKTVTLTAVSPREINLFVPKPAANLVVNSDFSLGEYGFSSDLPLRDAITKIKGKHHSVTSGIVSWGIYSTPIDMTKTSGDMSDRFLLIDDTLPNNEAAWKQTVTLKADTWYEFSYLAANVYNDADFSLIFSVNGVAQSPDIMGVGQNGTWGKHRKLWYSTSAGTAVLAIEVFRKSGSYDYSQDLVFALDDIQCWEMFAEKDVYTLTSYDCSLIDITVPHTVCADSVLRLVAPSVSSVWDDGSTGQYRSVTVTYNTYFVANTPAGANLIPAEYSAHSAESNLQYSYYVSAVENMTYTLAFDVVGDLPSSIEAKINNATVLTITPADAAPVAGKQRFEVKWVSTATQMTEISIQSALLYTPVSLANIVCTQSSELSITYAITAQPAPSVNLGPDRGLCIGSSTILNATYAGADYLWSNGATTEAITVNAAGTYSVVSSIGSCTAKDTIVISDSPAPIINLPHEQTYCLGETVTLDATNPGATYRWRNSAMTAFNYETTPIVNPTESGTFYVHVKIGDCGLEDTTTVIFAPVPSVNLGADRSFCTGNSLTLDATFEGADYLWSNGASTPTIDVNEAGTYSVVSSLGACTAKDTVVISSSPAPTVNLGADQTSCADVPVTLDATFAGATYSWSNGATTASISPAASDTYTVTVSVGECTAIDEATVTINPNPGVSLGGDMTICTGQILTLGFDNGLLSYSWNTGDNTPKIEITDAGEYSVTVSDGKCTGTDKATISVSVMPTVNLGADRSICEGELETLDASFAGANYIWSNAETSASIPVSQNGTYSVTVSVGTCTATDEVNVTVTPAPAINLGADQTLCLGQPALLDATNTSATYIWSNGATTPTISPLGAGTYSVTVSIGNCTATDAADVIFNPTPTVNLGIDRSICTGETTSLDATFAGATYLWSNAETSASIPVSQSGTYSVTVSLGACTATDEVTITASPAPAVNLGANQTLCLGQPALLDATTAGATYQWSNGATTPTISPIGTGTYLVTVSIGNCSATDAADVIFNPTPTVNLGIDRSICTGETTSLDATFAGATYLWSNTATTATIPVSQSGTYSVTVSLGACSATDEIAVTLISPPVFDLGNDDTLCPGEVKTVNITTLGASISWSDGKTNASRTISQSGTYSVSVTKDGCTSTDKITITATTLTPPEIMDQILTKCTGSTGPSFIATADNISWYSDDALTDLLTTGAKFTPQVNSAGEYKFYAVAPSNGCGTAQSLELIYIVTAPSLFGATLNGNLAVCEGGAAEIYTISSSADQPVWNIEPAEGFQIISSEAGTFSLQWERPGTYTIELKDASAGSCSTPAVFPVTVSPAPVAGFTWTGSGENGSYQLQNTTEQPPVATSSGYKTVPFTSYWSDIDGTDAIQQPWDKHTESQLIHVGYGSKIILLKVENEFGCTSSATDTVAFFADGLYVPSAFCPVHQSQQIAEFRPKGMGLASYQIWIYDNWGNTVWYSNKLTDMGSPAEGWDGKAKGGLLPAESYIWKIEAQFLTGQPWKGKKTANDTYIQMGNLMLLR